MLTASLRRFVVALAAAACLGTCAPAPALAHPGEAPHTWHPSPCWAGGEVWRYTGGTTHPDWFNFHVWRELWTGAYYGTSDSALQKHYFEDGGECGPAQFVVDSQATVSGYVIFTTKCAYYFRPQGLPYVSYRLAKDPQPLGCSMTPGSLVSRSL